MTPFYIRVGRFNSPFGTYDPYPMTPSLTQLLTQMRTGGVVAGMILENGLYAQLAWQMAEQSVDNLHFPEGTNKDRNYVAKVGYHGCFNDFHLNINADYIADIRDSDYLLEANNFFNNVFKLDTGIAFLLQNQFVSMCRAAGMSTHTQFEYKGLGLTANFAKALSGLNPDPNVRHSKVCAFDATAYSIFAFPYLGCSSKFDISYQCSDEANVLGTFIAELPPNMLGFLPFELNVGNVLPEQRFTASFGMNIFHDVAVQLQWVHDCDFDNLPVEGGGIGRSSNFVILRLSAQY